MMNIETIRKTVPILAQLDDAHLQQLTDLGRIYSTDANTPIFREGDPPDRMYVILSGSVRIHKRLEDGSEIKLSVLHEGDVFRERARLDNQPRSANATTIGMTELFTIE